MYYNNEDYKQVQEKISSIKLTDTNCTIKSYWYSGRMDDMERSDKKTFKEQFGEELEDAILEWGKNEASLPWNYNWRDIWSVWKLNFKSIGDFAEYLSNKFCPMCGAELDENGQYCPCCRELVR